MIVLIPALLTIAAPLPPEPPQPRVEVVRLTDRQLASQRAGYVYRGFTAEQRRRFLSDQSSAQFARNAAVMSQQFDNWFNDVVTPLVVANVR